MPQPTPLAHDFPFDPTYGHTPEQLLAITPPPAPEGFDAFWRDTFDQTAQTPLRLETRPSSLAFPGYATTEVYFDTLDRVRVGAWAILPTGQDVRLGAVVGHGYGPRENPGPDPARPHTAWIFPCAPGFTLSEAPGLPKTSAWHVLHGIDRRETYLIRHCVAAMWSAASALIALCPGAAGGIDYEGGSFGGGLGALALPWDTRFRRAHLAVPTFGHHPLRLQCPCVGSGEAVRSYAKRHPRVLDVLPYFDAAIAATRIRIPVLTAPALFDPAVPPPGQFAVCNALAGPRRMLTLRAGHFPYPEEAAQQRELYLAVLEWMS